MQFSHEKLTVYQKSLQFNGAIHSLIKSFNITGDLKSQLNRAAHSIVLNIAEGNGKFSKKDRSNYLQRSQGSALECAACLDLLRVEEFITEERAKDEKMILVEVVNMLVRMIANLDTLEMHEDPAKYGK